MVKTRKCKRCGKNIDLLRTSEIVCKDEKCQATIKSSYIECVTCGAKFKKTKTIITCSKKCRRSRALMLKRARRARLRALKNKTLEPDRKCKRCGGIIDKNKKNWNFRIYCYKKECEKKMKLRVKSQQQRFHKEDHIKEQRIKNEIAAGIRTNSQIYNTKHEDYFDHSMYLREMKKAEKTNGKICEDCGCKLKGAFHKCCKGCMTKRCNSAERLDGNYLFDSLSNSAPMAINAPKARLS